MVVSLFDPSEGIGPADSRTVGEEASAPVEEGEKAAGSVEDI